jgi:hypothetical protein
MVNIPGKLFPIEAHDRRHQYLYVGPGGQREKVGVAFSTK